MPSRSGSAFTISASLAASRLKASRQACSYRWALATSRTASPLESGSGCQFSDHSLAQAGKHDQVAAAQQAQRQPQLRAVLVPEVRDDDNQRALALTPQEILRCRQVVRVRQRRLHGVKLPHQEVERMEPLSGRNERAAPGGVPNVIAPTASPCLRAT